MLKNHIMTSEHTLTQAMFTTTVASPVAPGMTASKMHSKQKQNSMAHAPMTPRSNITRLDVAVSARSAVIMSASTATQMPSKGTNPITQLSENLASAVTSFGRKSSQQFVHKKSYASNAKI